MRLLVLLFFETCQQFNSHFSDDDNNGEFTLGDAVIFAWKKCENSLEHEYTLTAWALSFQPDIRADCMEQLCTDNVNLRKLVNEVVSWLHYPPSFMSQQKSGEQYYEIIHMFWKEFKNLLT